jgi:hypothetical protein
MQALMFFVKVCTCFDGSEFVNLVFISSEVCDSLWSQPVCGTLGFSWSCNTGSYEFLEFLLLDLQFRVQTCFGPGSAHKSDLIKASLQIDEKAMQDAQHTFRLHSQLRFRTWVNWVNNSNWNWSWNFINQIKWQDHITGITGKKSLHLSHRKCISSKAGKWDVSATWCSFWMLWLSNKLAYIMLLDYLIMSWLIYQ